MNSANDKLCWVQDIIALVCDAESALKNPKSSIDDCGLWSAGRLRAIEDGWAIPIMAIVAAPPPLVELVGWLGKTVKDALPFDSLKLKPVKKAVPELEKMIKVKVRKIGAALRSEKRMSVAHRDYLVFLATALRLAQKRLDGFC